MTRLRHYNVSELNTVWAYELSDLSSKSEVNHGFTNLLVL